MNKLNSLIGSDAVLEDGEMHFLNSNYMGPNTNLEEKLKKGVKPTTDSDYISMLHDIDYGKAKGDPYKIREADNKMLKRLKKKIHKEPLYALAGYSGIAAKNFLKDALGYELGKKILGKSHTGRKGSAKKILSNAIHKKGNGLH